MAMTYNTLDADNEEIDFQRMLEESIQLKHKITKTVKQDIPEEYNTDVHECPICYDEFMTEHMPYLKKCKHKFCEECLNTVLKSSKKKYSYSEIPCPYCRTPFSKRDIMRKSDRKKPPRKTVGKKPCKCGSIYHQRTNHSECPLNKKKMQL